MIQADSSEYQISVFITPTNGSAMRHKAFAIYDGGGLNGTLLVRMSSDPWSASSSLYNSYVTSSENKMYFMTVPSVMLGTPLKISFWINGEWEYSMTDSSLNSL